VALVILLLFALTVVAQPTVSNVVVSDISHSSASVAWSNSTAWSTGDGDTTGNCRIRYGSTTSYEAGALGGTQTLGNDNVHTQFGVNGQLNGCQINLYTLKANQLYHLCPQTTTNSGSSWSACVDTTFTTSVLPATHPALPTAPATFNSAYPDTTGYTSVTTTSNCSDLQTKLNTAEALRVSAATGTTINLPVGAVCSGEYTLPASTASKTSGLVTTSNNRVVITAHGWSANQAVRIASNGQACTGGIWAAGCGLPGRFDLLPGTTYYIDVIDANTVRLLTSASGSAADFSVAAVTAVNTGTNVLTLDRDDGGMRTNDPVQFVGAALPAPLAQDTTYCVSNTGAALNTFSLTTWPGCSVAVDITTAGSGSIKTAYPGNATMAVLAWPPATAEIIIRSAATDAELPLAGVRMVGSEWATKTAAFKQTQGHSYIITASGHSHGYRIGPGIKYTTENTDSLASVDPGHFTYALITQPESYAITMDRIYVHPGSQYSRWATWANWSGVNLSIRDSDFRQMNAWHGGYRLGPGAIGEGMTTSNTSTSVSWTAGVISSGQRQRTFTGSVTANFSGGAVTGVGCVWFELATNNLHFELPTGVTLSSLPGYATYTSANATTPRCPLSSGNWPQAASGNVNWGVMPFEQITFVSGSITLATDNVEYPQGMGEGTQAIVASVGPGPYQFTNNYYSGTGIPIHFDDSVGYNNFANSASVNGLFCSPLSPQNLAITRNTFTTDSHVILGATGSDGNRYYHRNAFEVKNGGRGLLAGNIIERQFADVAAIGTGVVIQAQRCGQSSDWEVSNNTYRNSAFGMLLMGSIPTRSPVATTVRRYYAHDNLFYGLDGSGPAYKVWFFVNPIGTSTVSANYGGEDFLWKWNTVADAGSSGSGAFHYKDWGWEGSKWSSSFFDLASATLNEESTLCGGLVNKALADCLLLAGTSTPDWVWTGMVTKGAATTMTPNTTTANALFTNAGANIYSLQGGSPLVGAGEGGSDAAASWTAVTRGRGDLTATPTPAATTASLALIVPDSGAACRIGYGTGTDPTAWSRTSADTTASYNRTIGVTGLASSTLYRYQVWCAGAAPTATATFTTSAGGALSTTTLRGVIVRGVTAR